MKRRTFLQSAAALGEAVASPFVRESQVRSEPVKASTWHVHIDAPCCRYARVLPVKRTLGLFMTIPGEEIRVIPEAPRDLLGDYHASANSWTAGEAKFGPDVFRYESFQTRRYDRKTPEDLACNRSIVAAMTLMSEPWRTVENTLQVYGPLDRLITEEAVEAVIRKTFGMVTRESSGFVWVMNPATALLYADKPSGRGIRQVPTVLHGIPLVIEGAAWQGQYVIPDRDVLLLYRDDVPPYSGPSLSTLTLFMLEDGTAECHRGKNNIVDDFDCKVTAPVSGVYLRVVT